MRGLIKRHLLESICTYLRLWGILYMHPTQQDPLRCKACKSFYSQKAPVILKWFRWFSTYVTTSSQKKTNSLKVSTWWPPNVVYFYQLPGAGHIQKLELTLFWTFLDSSLPGCLFQSFYCVAAWPRCNMAAWPQIKFCPTSIMAAWQRVAAEAEKH